MLAARYGCQDHQRLRSRGDRVRQGRVSRLERDILLTGEVPQEGPALLRDVIADRPLEHRIPGLQRVEDRAQRGRPLDCEFYFSVDVSQRFERIWEYYSNHARVWTSTDNTGGRSRTIGNHLSP